MAERSRTKEPNPVTEWMMHVLMSLAVCFMAAAVGGWFVQPGLAWYAELAKPSFTPPNTAFPVAWLILYTLMAFAVYLIWRAKDKAEDQKLCFRWFGAQLLLGVVWCAAFFYMRSPGLGLLVIIAEMAALTGTIVVFDRISRIAAVLMVPVLLWVAFAGTLNAMIWMLNG
jgi:benzodiazapine receptor